MGVLSNNDNNIGDYMIADFYFPTSKKALIIFTRNPELGKCKTRLAKTIGNQAALEVYKDLLNHTASIAAQVAADRFVFYSESIQKNDLWDSNIFRKKLQRGNDLGAKMENAFLDLFQMTYEKIVIIGSDLPDLETNHITSAFEALNTTEVVLGPALDGGYYLLGLSKMHDFIFNNKSWSQSNLFEETTVELRHHKIPFTTLETLNDIDTFEDLKTSKFYQLNKELQQKIKQFND